MMMGLGMGFAGTGLLLMLLFWGALLFGGFWLVRGLFDSSVNRGQTLTPSSPRSAREIAAQRYARGEISREEFEQIRHDLNT